LIFSEEEAKKRIYNVYFGGWDNSGFGCEIDEETCNKLKCICSINNMKFQRVY